jgi:hypothetical protein
MFEIIGEITGVETIAEGSGIRNLPRLRRYYGIGNWKKKKGFATVRLEDGTTVRAEICVFHAHSATYSTRIRPPSPRPSGH